MRRRVFLATATTGLAVTAGCLGDDNGGSLQSEDNAGSGDDAASDSDDEETSPSGGYEPGSAIDPDPSISSAGLAPEPDPDAVSDIEPADPSTFEMYQTQEGPEVPLVPVETAYYWYHEEKARFVDARGAGSYESAHITGSLSSPAGGTDRGIEEIGSWDASTRIVTYCGCPHHLSSMRAAELFGEEYMAVFAIEEGFGGWTKRDYPVTGEGEQLSRSWKLEGEAPSRYAGELAEVYDERSGSLLYASPIETDGSFALTVSDADADASTPVEVRTPAFTREATIERLVERTITA